MVGTLSGVIAIGSNVYPPLAGDGSLSTALGSVVPKSAGLTGAGALSAARVAAYLRNAALAGDGALAAAYSQICSAPMGLAGTGALTAPTIASYAQSAALGGGGALSATAAQAGNHFTDNFTRANAANLGSPWVKKYVGSGSLDLAIVSNAVGGGAATTVYLDAYGTAMLTDDHKVSVTLAAALGASTMYLIVRGNSGTGNVCWLQLGSGTSWSIYTNSAWNIGSNPGIPSGTQRAGPTSVSTAANDVISLEAQGNVYTARKNGTSVVSWTDGTSAHPTGSSQRLVGIGLYVASTSVGYLDNFAADDI